MKLGDIKIGAKFAATFALMIGLFLFVAGSAFFNLKTIKEATDWNSHTHEVLGHSNTLFAALVNQETGVRGYLVSADENFLEPFVAGQARFAKELNSLRELTADNPAQQERLEKLSQLEEDWRTKIAGQEIALMKDPATREQARALEASGAGKELMDAMREVHDEFDRSESALLVTRTSAKNEAIASANLAIIAGSGAILFVASLLGYILTRHVGGAVSSLTGVMGVLASGKNDVEVPFQGRGDEIGEMAQSVLVFRDAAIDKERMEREASESRDTREKERRKPQKRKASIPRLNCLAMACKISRMAI